MLLKTERLIIRHIAEDDWKSIKEIWEDFNASEFAQYNIPHNTDDEDVRARISKWAKANSGTEHMFFAVCLNDTVIGYIAFNIRENCYEIGYCFHSNFQGKGYAKESHLALFNYMRKIGITRFTAGTAISNIPSVSLLKALGFKQVGTEKVSFYKDAQGNDIVFEGGIFELEFNEGFMEYSKSEYSSYLIKGKLKDAIAYLEQFPEKSEKIEQYKSIFLKKILPHACDNPVINNILSPFYMYYHNIFFEEIGEDEGRVELTERLAQLLQLEYSKKWTAKEREDFFDDEIEPRLEEMVTAEGYHYLGGETQGHKGPYIWKETKMTTFDVQLPNQMAQYTVNLLSGFVSRSWLDYISLKEIGPGGWAGKDGIINCVIESYPGGVESEDFQIGFLKHEAQHIVDYAAYSEISSVDLEYRAKLVELIYSTSDIFLNFFKEASNEEPGNSHAYASYRIVRELSTKIWGVEYQTDLEGWKTVGDQIKKYALELYEEYVA